MSDLPEEQLLTRSDQPWEDEIDQRRVNHAMRWAVRQLAEAHLAMGLGMDAQGPEAQVLSDRIGYGLERRLTRWDLIALAMEALMPMALELADRLRARQLADLDRLDSDPESVVPGLSPVDNEHPVPLN